MRFVFLLFLLPALRGAAQVIPDSIVIQKGKEQARHIYERALEGTQHLYNGSEYIAYQPLDEEHPYFLTDEWTTGSLKYDGEWFYEVPLLFDIDRELLIASYYYKGIKMHLNNNRIDEFTIAGHRFINAKTRLDSTRSGIGFFELMYDGKTSVLVKRIKKLNNRIDGLEESREFLESNPVYLVAQGQLVKINTRHDILKALIQNKKELKTFIRKNGLFVNNRESSTVQIAQYFDSLHP